MTQSVENTYQFREIRSVRKDTARQCIHELKAQECTGTESGNNKICGPYTITRNRAGTGDLILQLLSLQREGVECDGRHDNGNPNGRQGATRRQ